MHKNSKKKQNVIIIDTEQELTPEQQILESIKTKNSIELEKLLAERILDLSEQTKSDALHLAIEQNFVEGAELLLKCDANIFAKNIQKETAYKVASSKPDQRIFELITQHIFLRIAQANARFFELARARNAKIDTLAKSINQALTRKTGNIPLDEVIDCTNTSARATILALSSVYKIGYSRINDEQKFFEPNQDIENTQTLIANVFNFKNAGLDEIPQTVSLAWPRLKINCFDTENNFQIKPSRRQIGDLYLYGVKHYGMEETGDILTLVNAFILDDKKSKQLASMIKEALTQELLLNENTLIKHKIFPADIDADQKQTFIQAINEILSAFKSLDLKLILKSLSKVEQGQLNIQEVLTENPNIYSIYANSNIHQILFNPQKSKDLAKMIILAFTSGKGLDKQELLNKQLINPNHSSEKIRVQIEGLNKIIFLLLQETQRRLYPFTFENELTKKFESHEPLPMGISIAMALKLVASGHLQFDDILSNKKYNYGLYTNTGIHTKKGIKTFNIKLQKLVQLFYTKFSDLAFNLESLHQLLRETFSEQVSDANHGYESDNEVYECDFIKKNRKTPPNISTIHQAIALNQISICEKLITEHNIHGIDLDQKDSEGFTALHWAIKNQKTDIVQLLLKYGANPNIKTPSAESPLELAQSTNLFLYELLKSSNFDIKISTIGLYHKALKEELNQHAKKRSKKKISALDIFEVDHLLNTVLELTDREATFTEIKTSIKSV